MCRSHSLPSSILCVCSLLSPLRVLMLMRSATSGFAFPRLTEAEAEERMNASVPGCGCACNYDEGALRDQALRKATLRATATGRSTSPAPNGTHARAACYFNSRPDCNYAGGRAARCGPCKRAVLAGLSGVFFQAWASASPSYWFYRTPGRAVGDVGCVPARLPLLLDLPLSLFLFDLLVLWVRVVRLHVFACIRGLGGCEDEDARKGEVEWKKGYRAETFRKTGKKGCEDAGMQKRSERRGDVRRRVGGRRGDAAMFRCV
ncbi:hypothetical protein B0H13DRAFT_1933114 [Mycena leptocephala]|nr:hypothetical protein B0H13DRAFT_1933114 [Mycena leptocephala]